MELGGSAPPMGPSAMILLILSRIDIAGLVGEAGSVFAVGSSEEGRTEAGLVGDTGSSLMDLASVSSSNRIFRFGGVVQ